MNQNNSCLRGFNRGSELQDDTGCNVKDDTGAVCGETFTLDILKVFNELYSDRLKKFEGHSEVVQQTLHSWVQDLTEQNTLLVDTVEKLEQEIVDQFSSMASETQGEVPSKNTSTQTEYQNCSQCVAHTQTVIDARTSSAQTENALSEALTQTPPLDPIPPWVTQLRALHISRRTCTAETQTQQLFTPTFDPSSAFRSVASTSLFRPIPSAQFAITLTRSTQTNERGCSSMSRPTQTTSVYWVSRYVQTVGAPLTAEKSVQASGFASGRLGERDLLSPKAVRPFCIDALTQPSVAVLVDAQTETGPDPLRTQLAEAMKHVKGLHLMLRDSHKASHDTQEALADEVSQRQYQVIALKKEVQLLEERLSHAEKQAHSKDDIIREMRKQLKMASSKLLFLNLVGNTENHKTNPKPFQRKKREFTSCRKPKIPIPEPSKKRSESRIRVDETGDRASENSDCGLIRGRCRRYPRSKFTLRQSSILELRILDCLREELTARIQQC